MRNSNAGVHVAKEFSEEDLLECLRFQNGGEGEVKTVALLGRVRGGKTTKLLKLAGRISGLGLRVGGICQPESDGVYFARDFETAESRWIARRENDSVFLTRKRSAGRRKELFMPGNAATFWPLTKSAGWKVWEKGIFQHCCSP